MLLPGHWGRIWTAFRRSASRKNCSSCWRHPGPEGYLEPAVLTLSWSWNRKNSRNGLRNSAVPSTGSNQQRRTCPPGWRPFSARWVKPVPASSAQTEMLNALTDEVTALEELLEGCRELSPAPEPRRAGSSSEDRPLGWDPAWKRRAGDGMARTVSEGSSRYAGSEMQLTVQTPFGPLLSCRRSSDRPLQCPASGTGRGLCCPAGRGRAADSENACRVSGWP